MEKIKTVDRTITLKIPQRFDEQLEILANAMKRTVESILKEQLYAVMENWYSGGFAEGWANDVFNFQDREQGEKLEKEVTEVANTEDC